MNEAPRSMVHVFPARAEPGQKVRFPDGSVYARGQDGSIRRQNYRRPWKGKAERRRVLQARRLARATSTSQ